MPAPHWYRTLWWYAVLDDEPVWPAPVTVQLTAHIEAQAVVAASFSSVAPGRGGAVAILG